MDRGILPGVPPGWEIELAHYPYVREWCFTLKGHGKEFVESFPEAGPEMPTLDYIKRVYLIYARLEAQSGIKFNWDDTVTWA